MSLKSKFRFSDADQVERGTPDQEDRAELRRQTRERIAMKSDKPCLAGDDLQPAPFRMLRHVDGTIYKVSQGEIASDSDNFDAYIVGRTDVTFLERIK